MGVRTGRSVVTAPATDHPAKAAGTKPPITHAYCVRCLSPRAACGYVKPGPITEFVEPPGSVRCVVCVDLFDLPCGCTP